MIIFQSGPFKVPIHVYKMSQHVPAVFSLEFPCIMLRFVFIFFKQKESFLPNEFLYGQFILFSCCKELNLYEKGLKLFLNEYSYKDPH